MGWERAELKRRAKAAFKRNYWKCVLVAFIILLLSGDVDETPSFQLEWNSNTVDYTTDYTTALNQAESQYIDILVDQIPFASFWKIFRPVITILLLIVGIVLDIFLFEPIKVGGCSFFLKNTSEKAKVGCLLSAFENGNYGTVVETCFLKNLFNFLWYLLLIIPGIIKAYEYRMIPYLLADDPELSRQDAFRISKQMMDGQKLDTFVLDLSFLGWSILSTITFGLVGIFFVSPYQKATDAELYLELKQNYISIYK